jgi:acyl-CoA synthetase (AMP-forming)/AMP-acid ligase II
MAGRGARVAYLSSNRFEGLETYIATMAAGMIVVPMNPRGVADEYAYQLNDSEASIVVYSPEFSDLIKALQSKVHTVKHWVAIGTSDSRDTLYESLLAGPGMEQVAASVDPDDTAWLFYTSGTTGKPKGAMETHRNLVTMTQQFLLGIIPDAAPTDVMFHAAPISHGSASCMWPHLAVGAANAFPMKPSFEAAAILGAMDTYGVTTTFLAPTMINLLMKSGEVPRFNPSRLKSIIYGGGPMYVEHLKEAIALFGNVFVQLFGQGEAPMTCTALPKAEHDVGNDPDRLRRLQSCGRELPGVEIRILDDNDHPVVTGGMGEICVRSDLVMKGYWNRPLDTAETLRNGWLHTGDVGFVDDAGYVFITDRKKDLIISGGSNIYPREVEECILTHPAVAEVSVFGVPDETWGEAVKAAVVLRAGTSASATEIIEHCRSSMASYKKPKSVEFLENLPKNQTGKILKRQLRDKFRNAKRTDQ